MNELFKKYLILLTPLILGFLELFHPASQPDRTAMEVISDNIVLWLTIHILQIPLFGLISLAIFFLIKDVKGILAITTKISIFLFLTFYNALDSITGIASGILSYNAQNFPPNVQAFVGKQIDTLFSGSIVQIIGLIGAGGWLIALCCTAIALFLEGNSILSTVLLLASGVLFGISHTPPTGPIGLGCFFLAVTMIDLSASQKNV